MNTDKLRAEIIAKINSSDAKTEWCDGYKDGLRSVLSIIPRNPLKCRHCGLPILLQDDSRYVGDHNAWIHVNEDLLWVSRECAPTFAAP